MMFLLVSAALAAGCLSVDGDSIRAADLARVEAAFSALPPETVLSHSPMPGLTRTFPAVELTRLTARFGAAAQISGDICVERSGAPVDSSAALAAMREALSGRSASIEIVELSQALLPKGKLEFPLNGLLPPGPDGVAAWRGWIKTADGRRYGVPARVRISFDSVRVVAVEALTAGQPVRPEQLREERAVTKRLERRDSVSLSDVEGSILRRSVPAGTFLTADMFEAPKIVHAGQKVEIQVRSGPVLLKLSGTAAGNARRGEFLNVKNPLNGGMLRVRAEAPGQVVAELRP